MQTARQPSYPPAGQPSRQPQDSRRQRLCNLGRFRRAFANSGNSCNRQCFTKFFRLGISMIFSPLPLPELQHQTKPCQGHDSDVTGSVLSSRTRRRTVGVQKESRQGEEETRGGGLGVIPVRPLRDPVQGYERRHIRVRNTRARTHPRLSFLRYFRSERAASRLSPRPGPATALRWQHGEWSPKKLHL